MATTIQVSDTTKQMLDMLKQQEQADSYDQVIKHLVKTHAKVPKSMFGSMKGMKPWTKADRGDDHDL